MSGGEAPAKLQAREKWVVGGVEDYKEAESEGANEELEFGSEAGELAVEIGDKRRPFSRPKAEL